MGCQNMPVFSFRREILFFGQMPKMPDSPIFGRLPSHLATMVKGAVVMLAGLFSSGVGTAILGQIIAGNPEILFYAAAVLFAASAVIFASLSIYIGVKERKNALKDDSKDKSEYQPVSREES